MWKEAQWARKSRVNLNVKRHLSSSSHVSEDQSLTTKMYSNLCTLLTTVCQVIAHDDQNRTHAAMFVSGLHTKVVYQPLPWLLWKELPAYLRIPE